MVLNRIEVNVIFPNGEEVRFDCESVEELKVKSAKKLDTLSGCIFFDAPEGSEMSARWETEESPPGTRVKAIFDVHNTKASWTVDEWEKSLESHGKYGDEAVLNIAQEYIREDRMKEELLRHASDRGVRHPVSMMIKCGTDLNCPDNFKRAPIHLALRRGHTQIARALIEARAKASQPDSSGRTPLHYAMMHEYADIAHMLIQDNDNLAGSWDDDGYTQLHYAAEKGYESIVEALIKANVSNMSAKDFVRGWTPLHAAIAKDNRSIAEVLIEAGVSNLEAHDSVCGWTALHMATAKRFGDIAHALIKCGVYVDYVDKVNGWTALHMAVRNEDLCLVDALIKSDANVEADDIYGQTPLDFALGIGERTKNTSKIATLLKRSSLKKTNGHQVYQLREPSEPSKFTTLVVAIGQALCDRSRSKDSDAQSRTRSKDSDGSQSKNFIYAATQTFMERKHSKESNATII